MLEGKTENTLKRKDRFFIGQRKWKMSHEEYVAFLERLKNIYKSVMSHKRKLMQQDKWKDFDYMYYIVIADAKNQNKRYLIQLKKRKQHIYRKLGKIMYKYFEGNVPKNIAITLFTYPPKELQRSNKVVKKTIRKNRHVRNGANNGNKKV